MEKELIDMKDEYKTDVFKKAHQIVNERSLEKEREYGPFSESMERASRLASDLTQKEITPRDFYMCMIALKLSRLSHSHKHDTVLDLVAYIGALDNYENDANF